MNGLAIKNGAKERAPETESKKNNTVIVLPGKRGVLFFFFLYLQWDPAFSRAWSLSSFL